MKGAEVPPAIITASVPLVNPGGTAERAVEIVNGEEPVAKSSHPVNVLFPLTPAVPVSAFICIPEIKVGDAIFPWKAKTWSPEFDKLILLIVAPAIRKKLHRISRGLYYRLQLPV